MTRPVLFFGGKGGVGKTTVAASRALGSAAEGTPTLLVSTDPAHSTSDVLGVDLGSEAKEVVTNLWAIELDPVAEAERYIAEVTARIGDAVPPRLAGEVERQLAVARASPGAEEAALFDRFARIVGERSFGRIVFDTAPSGHTLRLLSLPELMTAWMTGLIAQRKKITTLGRMWRNVAGDSAGSENRGRDVVLEALEERRERFEVAREVLRDPGQTAFLFVAIAERLPVLETHRIMTALSGQGIPVGGVIVNQVMPDSSTDDFMIRRKRRESATVEDIEDRFSEWPLGYLPLLDRDPVGAERLVGLLDLLRAGSTEDRT
ncbi:MAG: ArsA family ATPase [Gemmatimonadetes bacterium]|nr:ArsA family ATPase [Gemmatimonadota bacterium]MBT8477884.1 ArsA family ATPase [Gemmatimonadota bacterium]NNK48506.1 ArsA family ATPase [Gemmatimonadota bacterium]